MTSIHDEVKEQVRDHLWNQVLDQVSDQSWAKVSYQVRSQVYDQVVIKLRQIIFNHFEESPDDAVMYQVWDQFEQQS